MWWACRMAGPVCPSRLVDVELPLCPSESSLSDLSRRVQHHLEARAEPGHRPFLVLVQRVGPSVEPGWVDITTQPHSAVLIAQAALAAARRSDIKTTELIATVVYASRSTAPPCESSSSASGLPSSNCSHSAVGGGGLPIARRGRADQLTAPSACIKKGKVGELFTAIAALGLNKIKSKVQ
jgi:hypothetical protein